MELHHRLPRRTDAAAAAADLFRKEILLHPSEQVQGYYLVICLFILFLKKTMFVLLFLQKC